MTSYTSPPLPRFDNHLAKIGSDKLKAMVRIWGGKSQMRKDECIELISRSLSDPEKVRAMVARLEPFERNVLALIKQMGGEIELYALVVGLHATGVKLPARFFSGFRSHISTIFDHLLRRGLVLSAYSYDPGYLSGYNGSGTVFSDERLMAQVERPEIVPLDILPTVSPPSSSFRRPQTVTLDILSVLQAIDTLGGLRLTKNGLVRNTEQRKLMREMRWDDDEIGVDGFRFPNPSQAWISVLSSTKLLIPQDDRLVLAEKPEQFAVRPYAEQVALLLDGFIRTEHWNEQWNERWRSYHQRYYSYARQALILALRALPFDGKGWFSFADLDKALFARIGEHFSLDFIPAKPFSFSKSTEQIQKEESEWRARLRVNWLKRETKWIEQAFTSWLYFLGLVELGISRGDLVSFRLTDLGRAVLFLSAENKLEQPREGLEAPWIVQPNFEVVVYLDRAAPGKLAFLERLAERVQAQQHTASYRLTRESIYRGLESGLSVEAVLAGLRAGSETELPQNISVEIQEWAALREKICLHRRGRLLEFSSSDARQLAISQGLQGRPVGECFLLLPYLPPDVRHGEETFGIEFRRVDYAQPLPRCASINESGEIKLKINRPDLMIEAQLDRWAERLPEGGWRLSQTSVSMALKRGLRMGELQDLLASRLTHALPGLLRVALLAWGGEQIDVELQSISILRCRNPEVLQAIVSSKMLKPYILGRIAPDLLVVNSSQIEAFKEKLIWAGLQVGDISF